MSWVDKAMNNIKIAIGNGYRLSMVQLAGDVAFVEIALLGPDGKLVKFKSRDRSDGIEQEIHPYVTYAGIDGLMHGARAIAMKGKTNG